MKTLNRSIMLAAMTSAVDWSRASPNHGNAIEALIGGVQKAGWRPQPRSHHIRTGALYPQHGPKECARRRKQIAEGRLKI